MSSEEIYQKYVLTQYEKILSAEKERSQNEKLTSRDNAHTRFIKALAVAETDLAATKKELDSVREDAAEWNKIAARRRTERNALREAGKTLIDRMMAICESPEYVGVWMNAANHGMKYTGETWLDEMNAFLALLPMPGPKRGEKSARGGRWRN